MTNDTATEKSARNRLEIAILASAHVATHVGATFAGLVAIFVTFTGDPAPLLFQLGGVILGVLFVAGPLYINWKANLVLFDTRRPEGEIRDKLAEMRDMYGTLPGVGPNLRIAESIAALEWVLREEPIDPTDELPDDAETAETPTPSGDDDDSDSGPTPKNLKK